MTDLALTDTLSNASEKFDQRKNLRPWPRGVSGNPGGLVQNGKRYQALHGRLKAELGELNAIEAALLDRAVVLLVRRPRSDADAVKLTSEARRILKELRAERAKATLEPDIHDYVAAKAAEKADA